MPDYSEKHEIMREGGNGWRRYDVIIGLITTICLGLSGWSLKSIVELQSAQASTRQVVTGLVDDLTELRKAGSPAVVSLALKTATEKLEVDRRLNTLEETARITQDMRTDLREIRVTLGFVKDKMEEHVRGSKP